jgi:hypothetical protein
MNPAQATGTMPDTECEQFHIAAYTTPIAAGCAGCRAHSQRGVNPSGLTATDVRRPDRCGSVRIRYGEETLHLARGHRPATVSYHSTSI